MGLSRRAYAAHRKAQGLIGGTDTAVRKALAAGRIVLEQDGTIDPERADRMWASGTDASRQRDAEKIGEGVAKAKAAPEIVRPVPDDDLDAVDAGLEDDEGWAELDGNGRLTLAAANAADKAYSARMRKLRYEHLKGRLVERSAVRNHVFDLARKMRDSWMQMPARKAALMAAELGVDAYEMEQVLDRFIREHLAEQAEVAFDLPEDVPA